MKLIDRKILTWFSGRRRPILKKATGRPAGTGALAGDRGRCCALAEGSAKAAAVFAAMNVFGLNRADKFG